MKKESSSRRWSWGVLAAGAAAALILLLALGAVLRLRSGPAPSPAPTAAALPIQSAATPMPIPPSPSPSPAAETPRVMLPEMAELYAQNQDLVGWIHIEDTQIDYPVVFTPQDPEYYLRRDFEGQDAVGGTLFVDGGCQVEPRTVNLLIHGHNMLNGSMFQNLISYKQEDFYREHPVIQYRTLYEEQEYEILAAFISPIYQKSQTDVFKYYKFFDAATAEEFDSYISNCKALSFYDTGVDAVFGDELLTLSTCDYTYGDGRMVVVAKRSPEPFEGE